LGDLGGAIAVEHVGGDGLELAFVVVGVLDVGVGGVDVDLLAGDEIVPVGDGALGRGDLDDAAVDVVVGGGGGGAVVGGVERAGDGDGVVGEAAVGVVVGVLGDLGII
jgi:hypothetical protein